MSFSTALTGLHSEARSFGGALGAALQRQGGYHGVIEAGSARAQARTPRRVRSVLRGMGAGAAWCGLSVLAGWPSRFLGLGNVWPALAWLACALLLGHAVRRTPTRTGALVLAALASWPLAHLALFSLYFYPAARFYLAPAALSCAALGIAVGSGFARGGRARFHRRRRAPRRGLRVGCVQLHRSGQPLL